MDPIVHRAHRAHAGKPGHHDLRLDELAALTVEIALDQGVSRTKARALAEAMLDGLLEEAVLWDALVARGQEAANGDA